MFRVFRGFRVSWLTVRVERFRVSGSRFRFGGLRALHFSDLGLVSQTSCWSFAGNFYRDYSMGLNNAWPISWS